MASATISVPDTNTSATKEPEKKLKPCCACPETKKARDACIIEKGEMNCQSLIEAHKQCMRQHGFNIWHLLLLKENEWMCHLSKEKRRKKLHSIRHYIIVIRSIVTVFKIL